MKRNLTLLLAIIMLATLLSACKTSPSAAGSPSASPTASPSSSAPADTSPTGSASTLDINNVGADFPVEQYIAEEKAKWHLGREVELEWYCNWNYHYATKSWKEYTGLAVAAEILGISVTGQAPTGDPTERVNLMQATGTFPDIVSFGGQDPKGIELCETGDFLCFEDLAAQYEPQILEWYPDNMKGYCRVTDDGKMWPFTGYSYPQWKLDGKIDLGTYSYSVRLDIWKELGSPSIATPDELYNVLKLFKEKYPTMNGKDSVPLAGYVQGLGTFDCMAYSFGIDRYYIADDGKVDVKFLNPNFEEFMVYWNKLYREGLCDPEIFVKTDPQTVETLSTCAFMVPYVYHAPDQATNALQSANPDNPDVLFAAIPPMSATGSEFRAAGQNTGGGFTTYISKNCKDVEAALRLIAYAYSDWGNYQICHGTPGVDWVSSNGIYDASQAQKQAALDGTITEYLQNAGAWAYFPINYEYLKPKPVDFDDPQTTNQTKARELYDKPNSNPYAFDPTAGWFMMEPVAGSTVGDYASKLGEDSRRRWQECVANAKSEEECRQMVRAFQEEIRNNPTYPAFSQYMTERYAKNLVLFPSAY